MLGEQSRSPSPAAAPPIAATPGPRAANLVKLYNDAVSHTLKSCNYDNFAACFPTPAQNVMESLQGLHKDFVDRLGERCKEEFDTILRERNVISALNDLDRLVEEARKRRAKAESQANGGPVQSPTPPHALPASSLYHAHLGPSLQEHEETLSSRLQTMQSENTDLLAAVLKQRQEIEIIVAGIEATTADLDDSLASLSHDEMMALTSETLAMEQDIEMATKT